VNRAADDRDGVRVQNRTDELRQVTIGDRRGATTERRVDPGRVFVWSDPPDRGFELEVTTGDSRAVASIDPGTSPGEITVVVTPDGVEITHPGGTVTDAATRDSGASGDEWGTTSDPWDEEADATGDARASNGTDDAWGSTSADDDWGSSDTGSDEWGTPVDHDTDDTTAAETGDSTDNTTVSGGTDTSRSSDTSQSSGTSRSSGTSGSPDTSTSPDTSKSSDTSTSSDTSASSNSRDDGRRENRRPDAEQHGDTTRETDAQRSDAAAGSTESHTQRSESDDRRSSSDRETDPVAGAASTAVSAADTPSPTAAREAFAETVRVDERLDELERRAVWLDQEFRVPGTNARIGVSSIVGLLPGGGDGAMFLVAMSLVYHGLRLGASTWTLTKMSVILFVEFVISIVPILGDFIGAYWSANVQNVGYLRAQRDELDGSTNWVFVLILFSPSILTFLAVVSLL
jgi:hypothetical protein